MRTRTTRPEYPWNADRSVQQILPYLYQAGEEILDDEEFLKNHNIAYILSVTTTITPETNDKRFEYCMHIKVEDDKSAEIATHFKSAIEFITYARTENKAVVVHCQQGVSRSGAVILAYLIFQLKATLYQAWHYVEGICKKHIDPNLGFQKQLLEFQSSTHNYELKDLENSKTKGFVGVQYGLLVKEQFDKEGVGAYERSQMGNHQAFVAVRGVLEGGPASIAGIQSGDILLEINGEQISSTDYFKKFFKKNHSKTISVKVWKSWENCNCGTLDNPAEGWRIKKEITTEVDIGSAKVSDDDLYWIEEGIKRAKSDLKKAEDIDKTFEFSITGSGSDRENYPVGRYSLKERNKHFVLNAKKINTLRDFIGNEVKLLVNERHVPYDTTTSQTYSNEERIWTIKFHDLASFIQLGVGEFYAGRYSIEIFDDKKKETLKGPSGHYIFYKD